MKLKSTLGLVIGSLVAMSSMPVLAQGQGAVEMDVFAKRYFSDSSRDITNGNLYGGSLGYFLTEDLSLSLNHGVFKSLESNDTLAGESDKEKVNGHQTGLEAVYHWGTPGPRALRPYVSTGFAHQELDNTYTRGEDRTTLYTLGAGVKYYLSENVMLKTGVDVLHGLDNGQTEWMAGVGLGINLGGAKPAAPAPAPVEMCTDSDNDGVCDNVDKCPDTPANVTVDADGCPAVAEVVRVELDVKFDFDKAVVKPESYQDIQSLADFMKQYPQTTTTVEGHTDAVGSDAYNQQLSERRANAVREVLVNEYGVESERVGAVGYGEARPVADNASNEGRAINRRVEAEVEAQAKQ